MKTLKIENEKLKELLNDACLLMKENMWVNYKGKITDKFIMRVSDELGKSWDCTKKEINTIRKQNEKLKELLDQSIPCDLKCNNHSKWYDDYDDLF